MDGQLRDLAADLPARYGIDWLLTSPEFVVEAVAINLQRVDGRFPSDPLPVQAHVHLT